MIEYTGQSIQYPVLLIIYDDDEQLTFIQSEGPTGFPTDAIIGIQVFKIHYKYHHATIKRLCGADVKSKMPCIAFIPHENASPFAGCIEPLSYKQDKTWTDIMHRLCDWSRFTIAHPEPQPYTMAEQLLQ